MGRGERYEGGAGAPCDKMEHKTSGTFPRSKQPKALLSVRFSLPECQSPLPATLLALRGLTTFWGPTHHTALSQFLSRQPSHRPASGSSAFTTSLFCRLSSSVRSEVKQPETYQVSGWERHLAVYEKYSIKSDAERQDASASAQVPLLRGQADQSVAPNDVYPLWLRGERLWEILVHLMPARLVHSDSSNQGTQFKT